MGEDKGPERQENELDKNIAEIREWQKHQFNPGYFIGTGRVPRPLMSLSRYPWILILFGVLGLVPVIMVIIASGSLVKSLPSSVLGLLIPACLIYGGIVRLMQRSAVSRKKEDS